MVPPTFSPGSTIPPGMAQAPVSLLWIATNSSTCIFTIVELQLLNCDQAHSTCFPVSLSLTTCPSSSLCHLVTIGSAAWLGPHLKDSKSGTANDDAHHLLAQHSSACQPCPAPDIQWPPFFHFIWTLMYKERGTYVNRNSVSRTSWLALLMELSSEFHCGVKLSPSSGSAHSF